MKNYTSTVPVERTISKIEHVLIRAGASHIVKDYQNGKLDGLVFSINEPTSGKNIAIRLPANTAAIQKIFQARVKRPRRGTLENLAAQAERTAWKIIQDWVEVQISLIEMKQAEFLEIFMPYIWNGRKTFYLAAKEGGFKMLGPAKED